MKQVRAVLQQIATNRELRNKLLFTAGIFAVYRLLAHIPLPAVDVLQLRALFSSSQFLSLLNVFSGGTLANVSIAAIGINPYITASIIVQLGGMVIPQIKEMQKEGEAGKQKVNQYTRFLSVPLAVAQAVSVLALLRSQNLLTSQEPLVIVSMILALVAGALVVMWLGELITIHGIGNGISMILFAAIVSQLPAGFSQAMASAGSQDMLTTVSFLGLFALIIGFVVFMNEAIRKVPIQYAKRVKGSRTYGGQKTHLPMRVNVAGVMPIIFAVTLMMMPGMAAQGMLATTNARLLAAGEWILLNFNETAPLYIVTYFSIVFFFTFFSAMIYFNSEDISNELKKSGAFIPGIRPGSATKQFLEFVVTRITLAGALFLSTIAILPALAQVYTGVNTLAISGTSLLIVVSVVLDTTKQAESMMVEQNYDRYR